MFIQNIVDLFFNLIIDTLDFIGLVSFLNLVLNPCKNIMKSIRLLKLKVLICFHMKLLEQTCKSEETRGKLFLIFSRCDHFSFARLNRLDSSN